MLGMVPGAGTQQETEPTLPCLVRLLLKLRGDRLESDGWFTRWNDGQTRQIELGWGQRGVRPGWGFPTVTWQNGVTSLITAGGLVG